MPAMRVAEAAHHLSDAPWMAAPQDSPNTEATRSLEVRWIIPGRMPAAVAIWFARFPAETESREDIYLLRPRLRGSSVKIRAGRALEVKVYCGSPGVLDLPGRALGRMESWQKWSWPCGQLGHGGNVPVGWMPVRKGRRVSRFPLAVGQPRGAAAAEGPGVAVELTEIRGRGREWWSLGFEATGPEDLLRRQLEVTSAQVFAEPVVGNLAFGPDNSCSYADWLHQPG
jgi:hypothetical protein